LTSAGLKNYGSVLSVEGRRRRTESEDQMGSDSVEEGGIWVGGRFREEAE
jgi:hypothetical protein